MRFSYHPGLRLTPAEVQDRARLAALTRHRGVGDPAVDDARRNWAAARLADHIRHVMTDWPPLTDEQRAELVAMMQPEPAAGT